MGTLTEEPLPLPATHILPRSQVLQPHDVALGAFAGAGTLLWTGWAAVSRISDHGTSAYITTGWQEVAKGGADA